MKAIMTYAHQMKVKRPSFPFSLCLKMAHREIKAEFENQD